MTRLSEIWTFFSRWIEIKIKVNKKICMISSCMVTVAHLYSKTASRYFVLSTTRLKKIFRFHFYVWSIEQKKRHRDFSPVSHIRAKGTKYHSYVKINVLFPFVICNLAEYLLRYETRTSIFLYKCISFKITKGQSHTYCKYYVCVLPTQIELRTVILFGTCKVWLHIIFNVVFCFTSNHIIQSYRTTYSFTCTSWW